MATRLRITVAELSRVSVCEVQHDALCPSNRRDAVDRFTQLHVLVLLKRQRDRSLRQVIESNSVEC